VRGNWIGGAFALFGGAFITLQGVANARISQDTGTWQAAALTQWTGFAAALLLLLAFRDRGWREFKRVKPPYLFGGALAAVIIYANVSAIERIGVTLSIAAVLIAQLAVTFAIDANGWFGVPKRKMRLPQFLGLGLMTVGIALLSL